MWLCFNNAFLSVVDKASNKDNLLVRARRKGDIKNVFPKAKEKLTLGTDYAYRAEISRGEVAEALTRMVFELDYSNFKNSVQDHKLHNAYSSVWSIMGRLQEGGPYGQGESRRQHELELAD